ncbi:hypothetical protein KAR91_20120 [Candidatus Pacearchaeota archaeon]|nr:hypothetical protein [Candidatus Pacearchaeota archaeon]
MKLDLTVSDNGVWKPVKISGDPNEMEVLVKSPSSNARFLDEDILTTMLYTDPTGDFAKNRVKSTIVDWRGVLDNDDKPIPFSWENFEKFCVHFPKHAKVIFNYAGEAYRGLTEDQAKN